MMSEPGLLAAAGRQLDLVLAAGNAAAFLGWWAVWKDQDGVARDDLVDLVKARGVDVPASR